MGHFPALQWNASAKDSDGNGEINEAADLDKVQFDYHQPALPAAYAYQDYWAYDPAAVVKRVIKFGQGTSDGFLGYMELGASGFLDDVSQLAPNAKWAIAYMWYGGGLPPTLNP